jgi:D-alanyl-D-alanine carboxypeptidase/D-alanyl-D-alanine-endopeptidase (penicillin-binding protein 4)
MTRFSIRRFRRATLPVGVPALLLFLTGCATLPGGGGKEPDPVRTIEGIVTTPPLDQVHWGIHVVEAGSGAVLYTRNAHKKFVPASNMKILSTAAALSLLGPDHRYRTEVWGLGPMEEGSGVLEGDLVVRGVGDPTLSDRFYPSATAPLDSLAVRLRDGGLRRVRGALVVDASAWDSTSVPGSWMVGNLPWRYAATGGAFAIGEGEIVMEVTAGPGEGSPARVRSWPPTETDFFTAFFVTTHPDSGSSLDVHYRPESRRLRVEGRIPVGAVDTFSVAQRDPVRLAADALLGRLEARGIRVESGVRISWEPGEPVGPAGCLTGRLDRADSAATAPEAHRLLPHCEGSRHLATLTSPTMAEIVQAILEPSQNWMTEQLVRTLGMEEDGEGSWRNGFRVQETFLVGRVGADSLDFSFRDGSGLAAYNLVTPRGIVEILAYMRRSPHADVYRRALAEPGEEESTLRRRLLELEGRLWAKTGTITHVNSLSGYLTGRDGRELIFSVLTNGSGLSSGTVRAGIDAVVKAVAGGTSPPGRGTDDPPEGT